MKNGKTVKNGKGKFFIGAGLVALGYGIFRYVTGKAAGSEAIEAPEEPIEADENDVEVSDETEEE